MDNKIRGDWTKKASLLALVLALSLTTWLPNLIIPLQASGDALYYKGSQSIICGTGPITGWPINDDSLGTTLGSFAPTLPIYLSSKAACIVGRLINIGEFKSILIIGIILTVLISYWASMAGGLGLRPSLLISYGLATAPCSFSRLAHIHLSQLWAIMPCITVCAVLIARDQYPSRHGKQIRVNGYYGAALGLLSFTGQEYYAVFSTLCIVTCYTIGFTREKKELNRPSLGIATEQKNKNNSSRTSQFLYTKVAGGYIVLMALYLQSKQVLWGIPEWAHEATNRHASEQFNYGFWPLNILTSPLINVHLKSLFTKNNLPITETPFMSSSGILVIFALGISLASWINSRRIISKSLEKENAIILAYGGVLVAIIMIACIFASAGGLGTLVAVLISPQVRALNRITPYFYCAALVICSVKLDQVITRARRSRKTTEQV
ncbi:hypothetical protein N9C98_00035 [Synechococcus sp. AH-224-G16]|nr:hypothetical protein [Synechococcus sp. AH-224-G16]